MYETQMAGLEEEVHHLREREQEMAAIAFDVVTLKREKEEMQGVMEEQKRELSKRSEECTSYKEAVKECIMRCEECVRELQEARNQESNHQALICELQVRARTLYHVGVLPRSSSFWSSATPTLPVECSVT